VLFKTFYKKNTPPTHAGGVVFRVVNGVNVYLLVSAKRFSFIWVLPKGHIETSETEERAALREVEEESGIKASIVKKIDNAERIKWNFKRQVIAFYLMKFESVLFKNKENRKILWLPYKKAIGKLFYAHQKKILHQMKL
jgi:8-oxo-dGTP pyrophosphatase MutT (NUDIX family)